MNQWQDSYNKYLDSISITDNEMPMSYVEYLEALLSLCVDGIQDIQNLVADLQEHISTMVYEVDPTDHIGKMHETISATASAWD